VAMGQIPRSTERISSIENKFVNTIYEYNYFTIRQQLLPIK